MKSLKQYWIEYVLNTNYLFITILSVIVHWLFVSSFSVDFYREISGDWILILKKVGSEQLFGILAMNFLSNLSSSFFFMFVLDSDRNNSTV